MREMQREIEVLQSKVSGMLVVHVIDVSNCLYRSTVLTDRLEAQWISGRFVIPRIET